MALSISLLDCSRRITGMPRRSLFIPNDLTGAEVDGRLNGRIGTSSGILRSFATVKPRLKSGNRKVCGWAQMFRFGRDSLWFWAGSPLALTS
jgi:hypothetical protein